MNAPPIAKDRFGVTADGVPVNRYTLRNAHGMTVRLITYGATVTELLVPDRNGKPADVALGFDNLAQYETESPYFGSTAGRVAFRINEGKFTLDGRTYQLTINNPPHHLHGGTKGLSKVVWHAEPLADSVAPAVKLTHRSPAGDQGYPGNLDVTVVYTLTAENELKIEYTATTDRATPVNLTHHTYFNLNGAGSGSVLDHVLQIRAGRYAPTDERGIPSGRIATVAGTPRDFRTLTAFGEPHAAGKRSGRRLRRLLPGRSRGSRAGPGGHAHRPQERPAAGRPLHRAGPDPLHRQQPGRDAPRQRAGGLRQACRRLPGNGPPARLGQSPQVPLDHLAARRDLPADVHLSLFGTLK